MHVSRLLHLTINCCARVLILASHLIERRLEGERERGEVGLAYIRSHSYIHVAGTGREEKRIKKLHPGVRFIECSGSANAVGKLL